MQTLSNAFPFLRQENHNPTSPVTPDYNCIAWAAEEDDRWWWPLPIGAGYWPPGATRAETVEAFIEAFGTRGYAVCEDERSEDGSQKIAIYIRDNKPTHMARQLPDGTWTSKLGQNIDINHFTLDAVAGPTYGQATVFMKRSR